jgi:hypothetical protein
VYGNLHKQEEVMNIPNEIKRRYVELEDMVDEIFVNDPYWGQSYHKEKFIHKVSFDISTWFVYTYYNVNSNDGFYKTVNDFHSHMKCIFRGKILSQWEKVNKKGGL